MTEPQAKADKDAGNLSKTAKTHLLEIYIAEKYGRRKDVQTKQMKKGIQVEDDLSFPVEYSFITLCTFSCILDFM